MTAIVDARLGRHVLNWGESTFIPNGINAINPFDVSKLRLPGSELREALLPVGLASISVAPTDVLSVEGFYQLDWEETEIDAVGSYFSVTDYVGPGAEQGGDRPSPTDLGDTGTSDAAGQSMPIRWIYRSQSIGHRSPAPATVPRDFDPDFASVHRGCGPSRTTPASGESRCATWPRSLNDTEFGFYYMNHHSRLPLVSAHVPERRLDAGTGRVRSGGRR